jgi:hypothetical protein
MPDLGALPVPRYQPAQPYHYEYDNVPLKTLEDRDNLINAAVDRHETIFEDCAGTQGTLANRLNQFVDPNGDLNPNAISEALHNIAFHSDGSKTVSDGGLNPLDNDLAAYQALGFPSLTNPVSFVRMIAAERAKLSNMADGATNLVIDVNVVPPSIIPTFIPSMTPSYTTITFGDVGGSMPLMTLTESDSIAWTYESPNKIRPELKVSTAFAHRHFYNLTPILVSGTTYKVTSVSTPYIADSLRIFVNGFRLTISEYTESPTLGTFTLTTALGGGDIMRIDFDQSLT